VLENTIKLYNNRAFYLNYNHCCKLTINCHTLLTSHHFLQWRAYSFSSLFLSDVTTKSQKDHKLFSVTYILQKLAMRRKNKVSDFRHPLGPHPSSCFLELMPHYCRHKLVDLTLMTSLEDDP